MEKYNFALPEVPPNNEFNRIIKLVGEKLPSLHVSFVKQITYKRERKQVKMMKYEFLQTHTARRSFCSNEYLRGTDPSKTEQVTNLIDASFLKDRIKRSYLQGYQLKLKKLGE